MFLKHQIDEKNEIEIFTSSGLATTADSATISSSCRTDSTSKGPIRYLKKKKKKNLH